MSAAMEPEEAAEPEAPGFGGWGGPMYSRVKQYSSLYEYMELCNEGHAMRCISEGVTLQKTSYGSWYPAHITNSSSVINEICSSEDVVLAARSTYPGKCSGWIDYSKITVRVWPEDPKLIKKEIVEGAEQDDVAESEEDDSSGAGAGEVALQFVDLTDDIPVAAPIAPASDENASDAYKLHLNLWLPSDDENIVKARLQVQEGGMIKLMLKHKYSKSDPRAKLFPVVSPSEGVRVDIEGRKGLIWKVNSEHVAVVFDDQTCEIFVRSSFSVQADKSVSATAIAGVCLDRAGNCTKPCGFLYEAGMSSPSGMWSICFRYAPAPVGECFYPAPVSFSLTLWATASMCGRASFRCFGAKVAQKPGPGPNHLDPSYSRRWWSGLSTRKDLVKAQAAAGSLCATGGRCSSRQTEATTSLPSVMRI